MSITKKKKKKADTISSLHKKAFTQRSFFSWVFVIAIYRAAPQTQLCSSKHEKINQNDSFYFEFYLKNVFC